MGWRQPVYSHVLRRVRFIGLGHRGKPSAMPQCFAIDQCLLVLYLIQRYVVLTSAGSRERF